MEQAQASGPTNLMRATAQAEAPAISTAAEQEAAPPTSAVEEQEARVAPETESDASSAGTLRKVWGARGLFGGFVSIGIAYYGQRALIERNDYQLSTMCYAVAAVILILSLLHPTLPRRRNEPVQDREREVEAVEDAPPVESASPNGHSAESEANTVALEVDESTVQSTPLPTRKAGPRVTPPALDPQATPTSPAATEVTKRRFEPYVPGSYTATATTRKVRENNGAKSQTVKSDARPEPAEPFEQPVEYTRPGGRLGRLVAWRANLGWRLTVPALLVAVGLAVGSFMVLRSNVTSPLGGWLWAGSLVALLLALLGVPGWPRGKSLLPGPRDDWFGRGVPQMSALWSTVLLVAILLVAIALRLYNLEYHPGIFGDEGERGLDAQRILVGNNALIFGAGWWGVPNLYFYLTSFFLGLLGDHNMVADRMLSVVSGIVAVLYVYRTGNLLWGPRVGLIAGALMAVSPLALQFSRLAGESTPTGTLWAVGFFYMVLALRDRKWPDWVLSGLAWGFSLYFYAAGKLILPLAAALGFYCLVRWRLDFFKRYALGFGLLGATMVLVAMPYLVYAAESNFLVIMGRAQETSIFSPLNQAPTFGRYNLPYDPALANVSTVQSLLAHPAEWAQLLYQQTRETTDVLFRRADQVIFYRITEHGGTMFPPFWAVIVMLGLAYATWKLWDSRFGLVWIWFWFGMLGSVLTIDTPNLQRVTGAWPALMLLPAALLDRIFASGWPLSLSLARKWATVPLAAAVAFFGYTSVQEYFVHYVQLCPYCDATTQARYAVDLGQDYKAYQAGVGGYAVYFGYGSTRFLSKGVEGEDMLTAADRLPVTNNNGKGLAFMIYSNNQEYLPLLRLYYPGGNEEPVKSADGVQHFVSYKVSRELLGTFQVAQATYRSQNGQSVTRDEPGLGTERVQPAPPAPNTQAEPIRPPQPWSAPAGATFPLQAEWQAGVVAPEYGVYTFSVDGNATDMKLEIDGRTIIGEGASAGQPAELVLAKGLHEVRLSGTLADAASKLSVSWAGINAPAQPIAPRFLYKGPTGGLTGEVGPLVGSAPDALVASNPFGDQPVRARRVDPFIGFRETFDLFGSGPYLARWYGTLNIEQEGTYSFSVPTPPNTRLVIDDKPVIDPATGAGNGSVNLSPGPHKIELRYASPGGGARVELSWTTPGGVTGLVPPGVFTPDRRSWTREEMPDAPGVQVQPAQQESPAAPDVRKPKAVLGADAGLKEPRGLGVDKAGNIYIGDKGNYRVVVLSPDGKVITTWGKPLPEDYKPDTGAEAPDGTFGNINDIAVEEGGDGQTYVYVLDGTMRVQVFTPQGKQVGTYPANQMGLYGPNGLGTGPVLGEQGGHNLYVAVTGQNRLATFPSIDRVSSMEPDKRLGDTVRNIVGTQGNPMEQPVDMVADPTTPDLVYAIDLKDRLVQFKLQDATGATVTPQPNADPFKAPYEIARQWNVPVGRVEGGSRLSISPDGKTVYMTDPDRSRVAVIDIEGGVVSYFGADGTGEGNISGPSGIDTGPDGTLYVLERGNNRVQLFSPDR